MADNTCVMETVEGVDVSGHVEGVDVSGHLQESTISVIKLDIDGNILTTTEQEPEFTATFLDSATCVTPQYQVLFESAPQLVKEEDQSDGFSVAAVSGELLHQGLSQPVKVEVTDTYPMAMESGQVVPGCHVDCKEEERAGAFQILQGIHDNRERADADDFRRSLCQQMFTLQQTGVLCDIQIDLEDSERPLSLHSVVLAASCHKFRAELLGGAAEEVGEGGTSLSFLGKLSSNMADQLIRFVYTGQIDLSACEDVNTLLDCCQRLQIVELERQILAYLNPPGQKASKETMDVTKETTSEKRKQGRPKKDGKAKPVAKATQGSPLQKDKVDSTTSQDRVSKATKVTGAKRGKLPESKSPRGRKPKKVAAETEDGEFADDMIVSSTDDNALRRVKTSDSEEERVSSTRETHGNRATPSGRRKQEVGGATNTPDTKKPRGRGRRDNSQENSDVGIDETKSSKKKKIVSKQGTSLVESPEKGTSLGGDFGEEELFADGTKSVTSSRRTIKRPSWFNKDFVTTKSLDGLDKPQEAKKQKLSHEGDEVSLATSPKKNLSQNSPVRKTSQSPVRHSLSGRYGPFSLKTPGKTFSVESSEFLKGKMRRDKSCKTPGPVKKEAHDSLFVPNSGKKPKTIFTSDGRKRRRDPSVEIEYVIVNRFRSYNWRHYGALIQNRPTVDVYDMASHPVLQEAVAGFPDPLKLEGDIAKLSLIPPKHPKNLPKKPRSRRIKKVKGQVAVSSEEVKESQVKEPKIKEPKVKEVKPRGRPKSKKLSPNTEMEEKKKKDENAESVDLDMEVESIDTDADGEWVNEATQSDQGEESTEESDEEIVITSPVKRKRGRPRVAQRQLPKKKSLWKPKKSTFASQFRQKMSKNKSDKIRDIRQSSRDSLETGLCLILEMNYSMPRAAAAANVGTSELREYVKERQREGALKRVIVRPRGNTGQQFFCLCGKQFTTINSFNKHVDKYACKFGVEVFKKCGKCKLPYWDDETYLDHFDKEHPTSQIVLRCNYCPNYEVRTCRLIWLHMKLYHGISLKDFGKTNVFECKYKNCDYESFYEKCQQLHHREHTISSFRCTKCNQTFSTYAECTEHRATHRETNVSKCNVCGREFENVDDFKEHMLVYHEDALVPGYTKTKGSYFEDDNPENSDQVFYCDVCDFNTNSRNKLAAHKVAVHPKGNRDTICPDDNLSATFDPGPVTPAVRQLGPKLKLQPFECDICEGYHGKSAVNLAVHKFREHGEDFDAKKYQLFPCSECQFSSINHSVYTSHLDSHVGLNVKCKGCIRHFLSWEAMEAHAEIHQRGRRVYCEFVNCEFSCAIQTNLRLHLIRHQNQAVEVCESLGAPGEEVDLQMALAVLGDSSPSLKPRQKTHPIRRHVSPKKRFSQVKRRGGGSGSQVSLLRERARALVAEAKQRSPSKHQANSLLDSSPWQTLSVLTDNPHVSAQPGVTQATSGISFVAVGQDDAVNQAANPSAFATASTTGGVDGFIIQNIMNLNQDIADLGGTIVSIDDPSSGIVGNENSMVTEDGLSSSFVLQDSSAAGQSGNVVLDTSMSEILGAGQVATETPGILTLTPEQMSGVTITTLDYSINENGELVVMNAGN